MTATPKKPVFRLLPGVSLPWSKRSTVYCGIAALICIGLGLAQMLGGTFAMAPSQVWQVLSEGGNPIEQLVVVGLRLPRVLAGALVGATLAVSGAIFQANMRNPLASPDLIGFTTGSASGALVVIVIMGESMAGVAAGTLIGGFATALAVYLLAWSRGIQGQRLILVGIAIGAMLASVNDYLLTRAELEKAQAAKTWLFGSLHAISWPALVPSAIAAAILLPAALVLAPRLRILEMGDELAAGLGVGVARSRMLLIAVAVCLSAAAIAAAGPIGFVALAAPQLAHRLTRSPGMGLASSAVTGAALVLAADLLAQRLLAPFQIPVGLVTGALGGIYLAALLLLDRQRR